MLSNEEKKQIEKKFICTNILDNLSKCIGNQDKTINTINFVLPKLKFANFNFNTDCFNNDTIQHPIKSFIKFANAKVEYSTNTSNYYNKTKTIKNIDLSKSTTSTNSNDTNANTNANTNTNTNDTNTNDTNINIDTLYKINIKTDLSNEIPCVKIYIGSNSIEFITNYLSL